VRLQLADPERASAAVHLLAEEGELAACEQGLPWDRADSAVRQGLPFVSAFLRLPSVHAATARQSRLPQRYAPFLMAAIWRNGRVMTNTHAADDDVLQHIHNRRFTPDVR
jgi:hypothetical protein